MRVYSESLRATLISSIPIPVRVISGCHVADLVCGGHFSFSAMRSERREGLSCLTELAIKFPRTRRLVIADDDIEARLIGSLSPSPLDGVLSKASTLEIFHQELFLSLNGVRQATDRLNNQWYINQSRTLSPTERNIALYVAWLLNDTNCRAA